jgi:hypothetical protein
MKTSPEITRNGFALPRPDSFMSLPAFTTTSHLEALH